MKKFVIVFVVFCFCYIGYLVKQKFKNQRNCLEQIKNFLDYFKANMSVLKSDVVEIINDYKFIQNNKNAKEFHLFQNNENLVEFNSKLLERYIYDENLSSVLAKYFDDFGMRTHEFEREKLDDFLPFIDLCIQNTNEEIKSKGDLWFKILIAVGLVLAIVLW